MNLIKFQPTSKRIRTSFRFFIISIVLLLIAGCSNSNNESLPPEGTSRLEITLTTSPAFGGENTLEIGSSITIKIQNVSTNQMWLPEGAGIEIYHIASDGTRTLLEDRVSKQRPSEFVLGPNGHVTTFVDPVLENNGNSEKIIIEVTGEIFKDENRTGEFVTGSLELELTP